MIDLNTRIQGAAGLRLTYALNINESGEIAGIGVLPNGDSRAVLLIPCEDGSETAGCSDDSNDHINDSIQSEVAPTPRDNMPALSGTRPTPSYRLRGREGSPKN